MKIVNFLCLDIFLIITTVRGSIRAKRFPAVIPGKLLKPG